MNRVSDDAHLFAYGSESSDGLVNLGWGVRGRKLRADPCLVFRHYWEAETDDIDVVIHELIGHCSGLASVSDHDRSDGASFMSSDRESCLFQALPELGSVRSEFINKLG